MLGEEKERTYFKDSLSKNFCVAIPESFEHICSFSWLREEWIWLGHKNPAWFLGLSCNWKFVWKWRSLQHLCVPQEQELLSGFLRGLSWRPVILCEWECRENLASENPQTEDWSHCCWGHLQAPGREEAPLPTTCFPSVLTVIFSSTSLFTSEGRSLADWRSLCILAGLQVHLTAPCDCWWQSPEL